MKASIPALKGRHIITQGFIPVPLHPCAQRRAASRTASRRGTASRRDASLGRKRRATCAPASRQGCIPIGMRRHVCGMLFYRATFPNGNEIPHSVRNDAPQCKKGKKAFSGGFAAAESPPLPASAPVIPNAAKRREGTPPH